MGGMILSSCVGTSVLQRDSDLGGEFPSLHDVPDRPPDCDLKPVHKTTLQLDKSNEGYLDYNKRLRKRHDLPSLNKSDK